MQDPQAVVDARPTLQEITDRYEQMQQRIRGQLDAELGPFVWASYPDDAMESGCGGDFTTLSNVTATAVSMEPWGFQGGISDTDWPRAKRIVTEIIAEYGFTTPTLQIDKPGHHETSAADLNLGAQFRLGTKGNTSMRTITGCHRGSYKELR